METVNKMKIKCKKIFVNYISDKGLIGKICKDFLFLSSRKSKMGRAYEETFFQRRHRSDQHVCEKFLSITNHQENANLNHYETPHSI